MRVRSAREVLREARITFREKEYSKRVGPFGSQILNVDFSRDETNSLTSSTFYKPRFFVRTLHSAVFLVLSCIWLEAHNIPRGLAMHRIYVARISNSTTRGQILVFFFLLCRSARLTGLRTQPHCMARSIPCGCPIGSFYLGDYDKTGINARHRTRSSPSISVLVPNGRCLSVPYQVQFKGRNIYFPCFFLSVISAMISRKSSLSCHI